MRILIACIVATSMFLTGVVVHLPQASAQIGGSIGLTASPATVAPGGDITYTIHAQPDSQTPVTFAFATPLGTTLVAVTPHAGATLTDASLADGKGTVVQGSDPAFATKVRGQAVQLRFGFTPSAVDATVDVRVHVNAIWQQSPITARAYFIGTGVPQSQIVWTAVTPPALTGSLSVERFIDLNGNLQQDTGDIGETCPIYVYSDLTGIRVPDDIASPTDPRLPLVTFGGTDPSGHAGFALVPGRYSVYTAACNVPPPPSGAPETSFEVKQQPPATHILTASGVSFHDVQLVDIDVARLTVATIGDRPIGATAAPTDLHLSDDGRTLFWTDNADGEVGYHIALALNSTADEFDLPADVTSFVLPQQFVPRCAKMRLQILLAAVGPGGQGYPTEFEARGVTDTDCRVQPPLFPVIAPVTGSGPTSGASRPALPLALFVLGAIVMSAGVRFRSWRRGAERID